MSPFAPREALRTLRQHGVRFVLIGGIAGRTWGSNTVTNDVDVCYDRSPGNLERLAAALGELDARLRGVDNEVPFLLDAQTLAKSEIFTFDTSAGALDILAVPPGTAGYEDLRANAVDVDLGEGLMVAVCHLDDLIRMKRASGRPKDRVELEILGALRDERDRAGMNEI